LKQKINRYQAYNRHRKIKAINFNANTATIFFKVVPYLLHCNYPDLPGYIDNPKVPFGIYRFLPDKFLSTDTFRKFFPESTARCIKTSSPYARNPYIHSLKTIGSIGTIAQATKSDCDYWVSVRLEELGPHGLRLLQEKCRAIEQWALDLGVEIYFFLMDIDQTRFNHFDSSAEEESAGSALKLLLKDELFRSHILVAGKMLLWWLIPPGLSENEYVRYVKKLASSGLEMDSFIDLGYLSAIPKAEIFGACLWQLNKALDSPFKSVIKFAYLELLLRNKTDTLPLFSSKILRLVTFPKYLGEHEKPLSLPEIDPYLLLARDLVAFYQQNDSGKHDDDLIRDCLFLKALEGMKSQKRLKHHKKVMKLMANWDLLPKDMGRIQQIDSWNYHDLLASGTKVHNYLLATYKRLRWYFSTYGEETGVTISQRDISILGRKLFSFYEKKQDKIEYIRSLSRDIMCQSDITFHITRYEGVIYFYAFQGKHGHESIKNHSELQIRRETDILTLLAWLVVNGILQKSTNLHLTKNFLAVNLTEIQLVADKIIAAFPLVKFSNIAAAELLERDTVTYALVIINFHKLPVHQEKELQSTIISQNNYGEFYCHHFHTITQLKNQFRQLLTKHFVSRWNNNLEVLIPPQPEQYYIEEMLKK